MSFGFTLKEVNTINKNALNKPKIIGLFLVYFEFSDVIFSGTAVNVIAAVFPDVSVL